MSSTDVPEVTPTEEVEAVSNNLSVPGEPFAVVGNLPIYRSSSPTLAQRKVVADWNELLPFVQAETVSRAQTNFLLRYPPMNPKVNLEDLFHMMVERFKLCNALMCVGYLVDDCLVVYVRKQDTRKLPSFQFEALGCPLTFVFSRGGRVPYTNENSRVLRVFYQSLTQSMTTGPEDEKSVTFEQIVSTLQPLSKSD